MTDVTIEVLQESVLYPDDVTDESLAALSTPELKTQVRLHGRLSDLRWRAIRALKDEEVADYMEWAARKNQAEEKMLYQEQVRDWWQVVINIRLRDPRMKSMAPRLVAIDTTAAQLRDQLIQELPERQNRRFEVIREELAKLFQEDRPDTEILAGIADLQRFEEVRHLTGKILKA